MQRQKRSNSFDNHLNASAVALKDARPTAVNLEWAVDMQLKAIAKGLSHQEKIKIAKDTGNWIAENDAAYCKKIGEHGVNLIKQLSKKKKGEVVNIMTHCNAGWLAFVDHGSATAPIYEAFAS